MNPIQVNTDNTRIHNIASNLMEGHYAIPAFQRDYVWTVDQIEALVDTLNNRWPIGNMLVVERSGLLSKVPLKEKLSSAYNESRYMVLDGAQRCETIFRMMVNGLIEVFFDLKTSKFVLCQESNRDELNTQPSRYINWTLHEMPYFLGSSRASGPSLIGERNEKLVELARDYGYREISSEKVTKDYYMQYGTSAQAAIMKAFFELEAKRPRRPRDIAPRKPREVSKDDWEAIKTRYRNEMDAFWAADKAWQEMGGPESHSHLGSLYYPLLEDMQKKLQIIDDVTFTYCGVTRIQIWWNRSTSNDFNIDNILRYFKRLNTAGVPVDMDLFEQQVLLAKEQYEV